MLQELVTERAIQDVLQVEILRLEPMCGIVTPLLLSIVTVHVNIRIRSWGLCSPEMLLQPVSAGLLSIWKTLFYIRVASCVLFISWVKDRACSCKEKGVTPVVWVWCVHHILYFHHTSAWVPLTKCLLPNCICIVVCRLCSLRTCDGTVGFFILITGIMCVCGFWQPADRGAAAIRQSRTQPEPNNNPIICIIFNAVTDLHSFLFIKTDNDSVRRVIIIHMHIYISSIQYSHTH